MTPVQKMGKFRKLSNQPFGLGVLVGLGLLQISSCTSPEERSGNRIYLQRGYFLNSGDATIANPTIRNPFLDWAQDPEDQFRTVRPPTVVARYINSLRDFPQFTQKVRASIISLPDANPIALKVVAPAKVMAELPPVMRARKSGHRQFKFSLCDECVQKPDIVIVTLCAYGQSPCFGSFSYDQYGQSGLQTGDFQNGLGIIRGSNAAFQKTTDFCPSGDVVSMGGPIDSSSSRIPWFEFPEELSMQLLTGFSTMEIQRGESDWRDRMSALRGLIIGSEEHLSSPVQGARLVSVFEGRELSCRHNNVQANVERFMTLSAPLANNLKSPRVCIVSGHEATPMAQAELIARCAEFSADPMSELNQIREN